MFSHATPSVYESSRCFATWGSMGHVDPQQPPSKTKPWTSLRNLDFITSVEIILPQSAFNEVYTKLVQGNDAPKFERISMSLHDLLTGDFLQYIRSGDTMMLSEGRIGIDNVFCLKDGSLKMFLDKEAYERAGLVGKPHGPKGNRGLKSRWVVEIDLQVKSMTPGKKGFQRLVQASKNALVTPTTWMVLVSENDPVGLRSATKCTSDPRISQGINVVMPLLRPDPAVMLRPGGQGYFDDFATEIYEWLSLVRLESPRVQPADRIDPYLSRYQVPGVSEHQHESQVCTIAWQGLMSSSWVCSLLIDLLGVLPSKEWFALSASTSGRGKLGENAECCILRPQDTPGEYVMWEVKGSS